MERKKTVQISIIIAVLALVFILGGAGMMFGLL
jgi:hypothetical protein